MILLNFKNTSNSIFWILLLFTCINADLFAKQPSVSTNFELQTDQDIIDFTEGCCFFGVGGGGDPKFGQKMLQDALKAGKKIRIVDSSNIKDDAYVISAYLMGSGGPDTPELQQERELYGLTQKTVSNMPATAAKLLLEKEKVIVGGVVPVEIGGASTASAVATAAWLEVPVIDGDYSGGRALPEISQMIPAINGLSFCPLFSVDAFDNQVCILQTANSKMEEYLGKLVAGASFGLAGQAGLLIRFKDARVNLEKGTLSRAFQLGKALRQAREKKQDVVQCIMNTVNAQVVFKGEVIQISAETKDNYYVGEQIFSGIEEFQNHQIKVWFKNEYLELWLDNNPYVSSPDFICLISYPDGQPMLNNQLKKGDRVAIFAITAPSLLTSKKALLHVGPRYFGFNFDYNPFSKKEID